MDVVYPFKRSKNFDKELRYSLRSLSNLRGVDNVFIIGDQPPSWVQGVTWVPSQQGATKSKNVRHTYRVACLTPEISEDFVWMNDDIYIMKPMSRIRLYHRGPLDLFLRRFQQRYPHSYYTKMIEATTGHHEAALCYELHMPMMLNKTKALEILNNNDFDGMMFRTIYGNVAEGGGGTKTDDVKWYRNEIVKWYQNTPSGFVSSDDGTFRGEFEKFMQEKFPERGKYERY